MIEGDKIVKEAIATQYPIKLIAATHNWLTANASVIPRHIEVVETSEQEIEKASQLKTPQPVIAIASQRENTVFDHQQANDWIIALDSISDPGNLGTIIRSADWFGITMILCSEDCVDLYNAKTIQASMGSLFRVDVLYTNLAEMLHRIVIKKYAAGLSGNPVYGHKRSSAGVLVIGNEAHGISAAVLAACDTQITIPGKGNSESLNAAVACSIILSHVVQ